VHVYQQMKCKQSRIQGILIISWKSTKNHQIYKSSLNSSFLPPIQPCPATWHMIYGTNIEISNVIKGYLSDFAYFLASKTKTLESASMQALTTLTLSSTDFLTELLKTIMAMVPMVSTEATWIPKLLKDQHLVMISRNWSVLPEFAYPETLKDTQCVRDWTKSRE